jgi:hypothetical protein
MAANVREVARNLFHYANGNPQRIAGIKSAFDSAMAGPLTKGGMDSITSATKNGVTMAKLVGLNETERQTALRMAMEYLNIGFVPTSSRSLGRF